MTQALSIPTTCPQEIRIANHKAQTAEWWADPEYQAIAAKRIEGETCHYCGQRPATLPHHDEDWMYLTKEAYYDPANMTPACGKCHWMYRKGLVICPVCRKHYILRSSEKCRWCRGLMQVSQKTGKAYPRSTTYRRRHPCLKNIGQQRCTEKIVCSFSPRKSGNCRAFVQRVRP